MSKSRGGKQNGGADGSTWRIEVDGDEYKLHEDDVRALDAAAETNAATTRIANSALGVARETERLAEKTLAELHGQTGKIGRVDERVVQIKEDVRRSEGYLRFIGRCCVCFNCCVQDPNDKAARNWKDGVKQLHREEDAADAAGAGDGTDALVDAKGKRAALAEPPSRGRKPKASDAEKLPKVQEMVPMRVADDAHLRGATTEFASQDAAVSEISAALTNLGAMGEAMGSELDKQNVMLEDLERKADPLKDRLRQMNRKTKLGKIDVTGKAKRKESVASSVAGSVAKNLL